MVTVDDKLIDKLSSLCKLSFVGPQRDAIRADLERMLQFVDQIEQLDTTNVRPLIHVTAEYNHFREDVPVTTISHEQALSNAPKRDSDFIRVPKFVDKP